MDVEKIAYHCGQEWNNSRPLIKFQWLDLTIGILLLQWSGALQIIMGV